MREFDTSIVNGRVIDGTGNVWFKADIGIKDGKILNLGKLEGFESEKTIDAEGLVVSPGFFDIHNHSDSTLLTSGRAESMVMQGVTTMVVGTCGYSMAPITDEHRDDVIRLLSAKVYGELSYDWHSLGEFLSRLEEKGSSVNTAHLVGHGTIRVAVMGFDDRGPEGEELEGMKRLASQAMEDGAFGLSSGLTYAPASYAKTSELVELCKTVSRYGGIYATHMRGMSGEEPDNIREAVEIGSQAGLPVHMAHIGSSTSRARKEVVITLIEEARKKGLDITADIYPYAAGSSDISALLPTKLLEGGLDKFVERLRQSGIREKLKKRFEGRDWSKTLLVRLPSGKNKHLEGRSVQEIAQLKGAHPVDALCEILIDEEAEGRYISFFGDEKDLYVLMRHPAVMWGSDGRAVSPYGPLSDGKPHPRFYGTFPRVLGRYVPGGVLTLEEAIRKMTSQPAQRMGVSDRGLLREGAWADIVVFDPVKIKDRATYTDPHQFPKGVHYVLVNGDLTVSNGEHTGAITGKILYPKA